jgi:hypothetical protein
MERSSSPEKKRFNWRKLNRMIRLLASNCKVVDSVGLKAIDLVHFIVVLSDLSFETVIKKRAASFLNNK